MLQIAKDPSPPTPLFLLLALNSDPVLLVMGGNRYRVFKLE